MCVCVGMRMGDRLNTKRRQKQTQVLADASDCFCLRVHLLIEYIKLEMNALLRRPHQICINVLHVICNNQFSLCQSKRTKYPPSANARYRFLSKCEKWHWIRHWIELRANNKQKKLITQYKNV